jgi:hypothetical protein
MRQAARIIPSWPDRGRRHLDGDDSRPQPHQPHLQPHQTGTAPAGRGRMNESLADKPIPGIPEPALQQLLRVLLAEPSLHAVW